MMPSLRLSIVIACALTLFAGSLRAAEIHLSTENTASHFQTRFLEHYAADLNTRISTHHFSVLHSAQAFKDRDVAEALSGGRVAIAAPGIWHLGRFAPDLNALLLPGFMGLETQKVRELVDGTFGLALNQSLEQKLKVRVLGKWLDLGPAHIFTRNQVIRTFDDLKGLRIRYAGGEGNALRLKAMGAIPVLIPWPDVPDALDHGEIDGLLTTTSTVASASLWEHGIRHAFFSHSYYPFYIPLVSLDIWNRMPAQMQTTLTTAWANMIDEGRDLAAQDQKKSIEMLIAHNINIVEPDETARRNERVLLLAHQDDMANTIGISSKALQTLEQFAGQ
ncbi:hypothetical protein COO20_04200 [Thalassospira marina]|uniref:ABC transporter substrate-binding protein n=1 Tax=Thalassospira marina TaxID=2048283 RepID=A0A2N3KY12_9PROT|nr:hypothetical protein COO20_04200 [Thalassospira marina]